MVRQEMDLEARDAVHQIAPRLMAPSLPSTTESQHVIVPGLGAIWRGAMLALGLARSFSPMARGEHAPSWIVVRR
jgi:hypothetical protein